MDAVRASAAAWWSALTWAWALSRCSRCCSRRRCCCSCRRRSCRGWGRRRCWRGCRTRCSGAVSPAGVQRAVAISAPDDHFAAGPDCRVIVSASGRVGGAGGCPTVRAGIVSPAGVKCGRIVSTPDDHFAAGPDCRVHGSRSGRVGGAGGCPTIRAGIVSAAGVNKVPVSSSAPDDHFAAGPDCRVTVSGSRARWWCWWLSNCRCWDCICRRCSNGWSHLSRPRRSFRCRSRLPCDASRAAGALVVLVAVQLSVLGLYLPPVFKYVIPSAPDDHFAAGPHCRVSVSGSGRVGGAGGCPTIGAGIVSAAGVQKCR